MEPASRSPTESRERAVSSEPGSTRPNPFDDDGSSARKRRRTSLNGASRSRSVESQKSCNNTPEGSAGGDSRRQPADQDTNMALDSSPSKPQTPERQQEHTQPASESKPTRITLNLKNRKHPPQPVPSSPISLKDIEAELQGEQEDGIRLSVEASDLDISHTSPQSADPDPDSLPPSMDDPDGPPIVSIDDDDDEFQDEESQVAVLQFSDPMAEFPHSANEALIDALPRVCQMLPTHISAASKVRGWMEGYMAWAKEVGDIYTLFQHYEQNRDFLVALPRLVWDSTSPLKTSGRNHHLHRQLSALHVSFAKLTAFFIDLDLLILHQPELVMNGYQELASGEYMMFLSQLFIDYGGQVVNTNSLDFDSMWPESFRQLLAGFRSSSPISESLTSSHSLCQLGHLVAGLVPRYPRMINGLHGIAQMAAYLARDSIYRLQLSSTSLEVDEAKAFLDQGYPLFETVSEALTACIEKSVNQIATDLAESFIHAMTSLLRLCLRAESSQASTAVKEHLHDYPDIPAALTVEAMVDEWRLKTLTKFIVSSQMQLRLSAAHIMCTDLVRIYKEHQGHGGEFEQPILRHFSDTLLRSGVVAYILGPTCHPEVTTMSANIIGFLFASHTVTEDHMEFMWQTITTCQISGVSEALVAMLLNIAQYFTTTDLLFLCQKLQSVPIEAFNPNMRDFCTAVMQQLTTKDGLQELLPHSLMFRLLRESSAPGPPFYQVIQKWASLTIPQLLRYGPSYEDKSLLYQECLKDITQKSRYTLGSLHGLSLLCRPVARELRLLTSQYDLPRLLVDELEHAISTRHNFGVEHIISGPENAPRLELLISVICNEPDAIIGDLGAKLWELLVGKLAASQEDRDCAWHCLSKALKNHSENQFLEICFHEYLPTLPPQSLCPGALDFVLQKILHIVNAQDSVVLDDDDESGDRSAIEHLWRIILTAPSGTIEGRAIVSLIQDVYVENQCILSFSKHRARKVHLALVDRCMKQLSSAAGQLTSIAQAGTNDHVDAMTVTVDQIAGSAPEIVFSRSLAILRQFHKVYQQTPHFSTPDMRSLILPEQNDVQGDSAELKFQSFDGDTQTEVKPLTIGRQNTAGSLLAGIRDATGFDNYRLYYKGQAFTPSEQDICKSLEDLQIHNGLILVKRESDTAEQPVHVRPGASPVEVEIMGHFGELWQYLGLEERLASEVRCLLLGGNTWS